MWLSRDSFCEYLYEGFGNVEKSESLVRPAKASDFKVLFNTRHIFGRYYYSSTLKKVVSSVELLMDLQKGTKVDELPRAIREIDPYAIGRILCWVIGVECLEDIHRKVQAREWSRVGGLREIASASRKDSERQGRYEIFLGDWVESCKDAEIKMWIRQYQEFVRSVEPESVREDRERLPQRVEGVSINIFMALDPGIFG